MIVNLVLNNLSVLELISALLNPVNLKKLALLPDTFEETGGQNDNGHTLLLTNAWMPYLSSITNIRTTY